ncbi:MULTISPECIES: hypothetical protein [Bacillaceae]|nr:MULTISPECIES: hypothetical protein [Bacillaceae]
MPQENAKGAYAEMEFFLIMFITFILAIAIASGGLHLLFKQINNYLNQQR